MATVRYMVEDVDSSAKFYIDSLGFSLVEQFGPAMAILKRGDLSLWLAGPSSSAGRAAPDGKKPVPGGWNRIVIEVDNLSELVGKLRFSGVILRSEIVPGPRGSQILCEDPSGNAVELFEPA